MGIQTYDERGYVMDGVGNPLSEAPVLAGSSTCVLHGHFTDRMCQLHHPVSSPVTNSGTPYCSACGAGL